jgi:3-deoxy-D-manno-octulosonic-acid transferase
MLYFFDQLFVQTAMSKKYLEEIGLGSKCTFSNDTRFDRVLHIANQFKPISSIEKFIGTHKAIIAGSTWPEDEKIIQQSLSVINSLKLKLIIAPHEINEKKLSLLLQKFPGSILYSQLTVANQPSANADSNTVNNEDSNCLIIDNYGMLSRLYKYAYISYVGGGHTKNGVHNVLEAAVYGKPVLFGPYYEKYNEAIGLVEAEGGFSFKNETSFNQLLEQFTKNENDYTKSCAAAAAYVNSNKGATEKVMGYIQENRLLTN